MIGLSSERCVQSQCFIKFGSDVSSQCFITRLSMASIHHGILQFSNAARAALSRTPTAVR